MSDTLRLPSRTPTAADARRLLPLPGTSARLPYRPRVVVAIGLLAAAVVGVAAWSLTLGSYPIGVGEVVATLLGTGGGEHDLIVRTLRLPRTLAAIGVGIALAISGAIFQALVRNPLVSPDVIGVSSGATLAAVSLIAVVRSPSVVPAGALLGALVTAAALYALTWKRGVSGERLVLVGIAVEAMLFALTTMVFVRFPIEAVAPAVLWATGTLHARTWTHVGYLAVGLALLLPLALAGVRRLRALQLGDDAARALGSRVEASRALLLAIAAALAAVAVAAAGPVAFVALMVPHLARLLLGQVSAGVLIATGLLGALLVQGSDIIAQHALPVSLPVGVVTAAVGAPYFLFLLYRTQKGS